jgi:uncharacterized protein YqeY
MTIQVRLIDAMKTAMKAQDSLRLSAIRMARTAIKNAEIEARGPLDDAGVIKVLSTLVKQRRESAEAYRDTRPELAAKEEQELAILQEFLPAQMDAAELKAIIEAAVRETGATGPRDMGAVMKLVTPRTTGRADGRLVSELVKARLAG